MKTSIEDRMQLFLRLVVRVFDGNDDPAAGLPAGGAGPPGRQHPRRRGPPGGQYGAALKTLRLLLCCRFTASARQLACSRAGDAARYGAWNLEQKEGVATKPIWSHEDSSRLAFGANCGSFRLGLLRSFEHRRRDAQSKRQNLQFTVMA